MNHKPQRDDALDAVRRVGRSPGRPALSRLEQDYELTFGVLLGLTALAVLLHLLGVGR